MQPSPPLSIVPAPVHRWCVPRLDVVPAPTAGWLCLSRTDRGDLDSGKFAHQPGRLKRAWKFSTVELLVNVINPRHLRAAWPPLRSIFRLRHSLVEATSSDGPRRSSSVAIGIGRFRAHEQDSQVFNALIIHERMANFEATYRPGIRSTFRCSSCSFAAVAGPTAAMRTPPISRKSSTALKK